MSNKKKVMYRGFIISLSIIPTKYGTCYKASNNYGEPYMDWKGYRTEQEAVKQEEKNLDLCIDQ